MNSFDLVVRKRHYGPLGWFAVTALVLAFPPLSLSQTSQKEVQVLMSGGFWAAFQEIKPDFEKATGIKISVTRGPSQGDAPNTIGAQLRRGVPADVVIMTREGLNDLVADGRIVAGSDVNLAQSPLGLAVHSGAPKPDISSVEAFKRIMLQAKSVTSPSTGGIYLKNKLFPQLGIADEMTGKITTTGVAAVVSGDAQIAVQPRSELLHAPGIDFVGTLPPEIQHVAVFSAAIVKGTTQATGAKELIDFLRSEKGIAAAKRNGMEPVN